MAKVCSSFNCSEIGREFLNGKCPEHYMGNKDCTSCKGEYIRCTTCAFTCPNCLNRHWNAYCEGLCNICDIWRIVGRQDMLKKRRSRVIKESDDTFTSVNIINSIFRQTFNTNGEIQDIRGAITQDANGNIVLTFTLLKN